MAVKILVPATSANVGAGFDALGLALSLHNTVTMEEWDKLDIMASDGSLVPTGTSNLIYRSAKAVYEQLGKPIKGLRIRQENPIPMARGLGSSSACIVAGILGANALLGNPLTKRQMLTLATSIEGHPDNVAPAMLGGFVSSVFDEGQVFTARKEINEELAFAASSPTSSCSPKKPARRCPKPWTGGMRCTISPARRWPPLLSAMATTSCCGWPPKMPCISSTACP